MSDTNSPFQLRYILNPLYWPTWLGLGFLWLTTRMPYRVILFLGASFGMLSMLLLADRRRVTRTNIRLCFPELSRKEQRRLLRRNFYSNGMALFETALAWWGSEKKLQPLLHIEGLDNLKQAEAKGNGVIMLGGHYATLEIGGRVMSVHTNKVVPTYKSARNKVFELVMARSRKKTYDDLIKSMNMRDVIRALKNNKFIWYAPDQDFDRKSSIFVPFMGIPTLTLTLTSRLAKLSGAPVIPWYSERLPGNQGYKVTIAPALEHFPSGDDYLDTKQVNDIIEKHVRHVPEQYLWGHRRFKTRPPGEPQLYQHRVDKLLRRYKMLLALLSLPLLIYTLWIAYRNRDLPYLRQKYGIYPKTSLKADLWIHASSVGEINAVLPLIMAIHDKHPKLKIIVTTFTPTGGAVARKALPADIPQYYLPHDYEYAVQAFLDFSRPACSLIMETELWPQLHQYCFNRGIPVFIINGRLSDKTLKTKRWLINLLARTIEFTRFILARTEEDRRRFIAMNAIAEKVQTVGNIKFAITEKAAPDAIDLGRPYVLATSTHEDEEFRLASLWQKMKIDSHVLVIIPRHPHRAAKIVKQISSVGLELAVRSQEQPVTNETEIYLADTFGEVGGFIAGSDFVFMGGTLVDAGGHNILEVGVQGKAVIFGPYMYNFADERALFLKNEAAIEIKDMIELGTAIQDLLKHPSKRTEIGNRASEIIQEQQHILKDYLNVLEKVCPVLSNDDN